MSRCGTWHCMSSTLHVSMREGTCTSGATVSLAANLAPLVLSRELLSEARWVVWVMV